MKVCPILQAGTMLTGIMVKTHFANSFREDMNHFAFQETSKCMGKRCEWYGCGCPAHSSKSMPTLRDSIIKRDK